VNAPLVDAINRVIAPKEASGCAYRLAWERITNCPRLLY
jgi:hypothetical protein